MRLNELFMFEDDEPKIDVKGQLQQVALDLLTPLVAHKVPFITVQQLIDELRGHQPGILVDRALVMNILNPNTVKIIQSIEGDKIILQAPADKNRAIDNDQAETEVEKIKDMAKDQAKKEVRK